MAQFMNSLDDISQLVKAPGYVGPAVPQGLVLGHCSF